MSLIRTRRLTVALAVMLAAGSSLAAELSGYSRLPSGALVAGPDSGQFITAPEGISTPFRGQVAQGFSAIIADGRGGFIALTDNGFGTRENSRDFVLRLYFLDPAFRTASGGLGQVQIDGFIGLSDPERRMPHKIMADRECYDSESPCRQVGRRIRSNRLLTGADLDPESLQPGRDGTFWIGDEFGPYILHFGSEGELLTPPFTLEGLRSPQRLPQAPEAVTVRTSKGFEGMARGPFGDRLYPMLEGPLSDREGEVPIYTFNIPGGKFINRRPDEPSLRYPLDEEGGAIGAFKLYSAMAGLVIERDSGEGKDARFKKIFRIAFDHVDEEGLLIKEEIVDLLDLEDPNDLNRDGDKRFSLPMSTIEGLVIQGRNEIAVITDNNFPFGKARGTVPEDTEFVLIRVPDLW
ncbi:MAG: esterase-like activity of phytase family protein [Xanthomonadales bacterium]|nr:esterase-like activity of phytase family protein [Xanthomonadales bacterium]